MNNFEFYNPTRLIFGKGTIAKLKEYLPKNKHILVTFGGGSVKHNGVYNQVVEALKEYNYTEFWGIEPNPSVETLRKVVELGKECGAGFLLAVGGGSVLDGTKLIAAAIANPEIEPWDLVLKGYAPKTLPLASIMTIPATGSEMNSGAVISRYETQEKYPFYNTFPTFSILDPEVTYTLPTRMIACGLADIFVHVMEQYLTTTGQSRVMDRWSEGILLSVMEVASKALKKDKEYDIMADYMLCATLALNDMIAMGVSQDWATHMIGHEITALRGLTHGASLAIVLPGTMRVLKKQKWGKILQYGERVLNITEGTEEERVDKAIERTEEFFRSLGLSTRLGEENIGENTIEEVAARFNKRNVNYGEGHNVNGTMAMSILKSCL